MGTDITLTTRDGATLGAYRAEPAGTPRGGIVVLQEIFGVNPHIRRVTDGYAAQGYLAVAPALFDRVSPGLQLGYDQPGREQGVAVMKQTVQADTLSDIAAAIAEVAEAGKVGLVGFCWGGTLAYAAAAQLPGLAAAVGYYGGGIASMLDDKPKVPVMLHFGETDAHIPMPSVEAIREALPGTPVFTYAAGHGFNCDARDSYDKPSADLALSRTLAFLGDHVG
jgi:carboxymethylenebutenolidase